MASVVPDLWLITFPVIGHHCHVAGTKSYCTVRGRRDEQLARGLCLTAEQLDVFEVTER